MLSDDPLLRDADRVQHDAELSSCSLDHTTFKFSTRCIWFYFACQRRALGGLQNIREKALRNLSRLMPNGYQGVANILPEAYNEAAMMVEIELSSAAFLRRTENLDRWLKASAFACEMVLKKDMLEFEPLFCLEDVLSVLSIFEQYLRMDGVRNRFTFPDSVYLPAYFQPIFSFLMDALDDASGTVGSFINIHMKADMTKVVPIFGIETSACTVCSFPKSPPPSRLPTRRCTPRRSC